MLIREIINFLNTKNVTFDYKADESLPIKKIGMPGEIEDNSIYWAKNQEKLAYFSNNDTSKLLVIVDDSVSVDLPNFITVKEPKNVFFLILEHFFGSDREVQGIDSSAVVLTKNIGNNVTIGANTYISENSVIGNNVWIKNNVSIEGKVTIKDNSIISSGCVIGSDGYGYVKDQQGQLKKIPHYGGVQLGENVEIGANTCIDRGTLGDTIIGDNVKIDNLCHIAHNVVIEENVNVIAMSMIAGSVKLKKNSYVAPSASIINQVTVGENSLVGLGAVVVKDVADNVIVAGVPAKYIKENK